jgi:hypothetical protein
MASILHSRSPITTCIQCTLVSLALLLPVAAFAADAQWVLAQDEDRIQLYTRPVEGSPFLEVKALAQINAPITEVATVMGDGDGCDEWRAMCKSSEILSTLSETEQLVYLVMDMPWPVADRDMVIHSIALIDVEAKNVTVELQSAPNEHSSADYVRATTSGRYEIQAINEGQVQLTYIMHTDLGGDLSANMINPRLVSATFDDIKRLQDLSER